MQMDIAFAIGGKRKPEQEVSAHTGSANRVRTANSSMALDTKRSDKQMIFNKAISLHDVFSKYRKCFQTDYSHSGFQQFRLLLLWWK
jgi:hypothetical protein